MVDVSAPRIGLTKRRLSAARQDENEQALGRFVRVETWNGLEAGDVVRVSGHAARGRHWRFRSHVTNTSNGASWVEVCLVEGPPPSRRPSAPPDEEHVARVERVRSFAPDLVTPRWKRRGRKASQAAAGGNTAPFQQSMF